jgi:hypothetical protein
LVEVPSELHVILFESSERVSDGREVLNLFSECLDDLR